MFPRISNQISYTQVAVIRHEKVVLNTELEVPIREPVYFTELRIKVENVGEAAGRGSTHTHACNQTPL